MPVTRSNASFTLSCAHVKSIALADRQQRQRGSIGVGERDEEPRRGRRHVAIAAGLQRVLIDHEHDQPADAATLIGS